MDFGPIDPQDRLRAAWGAVNVARPVHYSLFTFGESDLPYFLVEDAGRPREPVRLTRGEVKITRPVIITPDSMRPEFQGFFEDEGFDDVAEFLLAHRHYVILLDHVVQALLPLYLARAGTFLLDHATSPSGDVDAAVESLCERFELIRPRIVERWSQPAVR